MNKKIAEGSSILNNVFAVALPVALWLLTWSDVPPMLHAKYGTAIAIVLAVGTTAFAYFRIRKSIFGNDADEPKKSRVIGYKETETYQERVRQALRERGKPDRIGAYVRALVETDLNLR